MIHSPVGIRCQNCGKATRLPTYDVSRSHMARAIVASLLIGVAGGLAFAVILRPLLFGLIYIAAMGGYGYIIGESISRVANQKRGRTLQYISAGGVVVAEVVIAATISINFFDLLGAGFAIYISYIRLR